MLARHDSRFVAVTAPLRSPLARAVLFACGVCVLMIVAWALYRPGLHGDFLFDDFANLPALGATGPVHDWPTFWRYITSGTADPTGRPLTLATFLLDARDWPADAYPFKVTNVLLHLLNGALLAAVLVRLSGMVTSISRIAAPVLDARSRSHSSLRTSRSDDPESNSPHSRWTQVRFAALFGAGAWLLHPFFVSTTLYVVQREAMLPATFVLLGMLGWIAARTAYARGAAGRGIAGMWLSAWGCTLLASLSKANGALLPLLLLLVEWIVLSPAQPIPSDLSRKHKRLLALVLGLPIALLAFYMLAQLPGAITATPEIRNWTLWQRLLSEPRALCDYLALLFVPRIQSTGLFTDGFIASRDLLHPASTLWCIAIVFGLIAAAFALRKRHPAFALAVLFYFSAQLLESTWIPLELYYEHRNYLPAMLLFWPIGLGLGARGAFRWARAICAATILAALAAITFQRAELWGDGYRQAMVWAAFNPDSARAQTDAALYDLAHDRPRLAQARLLNALPEHPHDVQIPVNLITAECRLHALRPQSLQALSDALATSKVGGTVGFEWFNNAIDSASRRACAGLDLRVVSNLLDATRRNPWWAKARGQQQDLAHLQGMLDLAEGQPQAALQAFDRALALKPRPDTALKQAAILGSRGYPALGLSHLDYWSTLPAQPKPRSGMPMIHAWVLDRQQYWQMEATRLRDTLQRDAARRADANANQAAAKAPTNG